MSQEIVGSWTVEEAIEKFSAMDPVHAPYCAAQERAIAELGGAAAAQLLNQAGGRL